MVTSIPITKARVNLGGLVKKVVLNKEYFVLEKSGIPVAGIIDIEEFEDLLEMQDANVKNNIEKGYREYKKGKTKSLNGFLKKYA